MNIYKLCFLIFVFCSLAGRGETTIVDVSRQFLNKQIGVDSLFNYINNGHEAESYWWALHNAEKDDPMANYILGRCYLAGIGTTEDMPKAAPAFEKAISLGVSEGYVDLGKMYLNGWGVEKNRTKSLEYLNKACEKGSGRGYDTLGLIYMDAKDYQKAYQLFNAAASAGYSGGYLNIGYMCEQGYGVKEDQPKALEYYRKAAEMGNSIALCNIGVFYEFGKGVEVNHETALKYYMASALRGDGRGNFKVGYIKENGDILENVSHEEAVKWYKIAAEKDYVPAKEELAYRYLTGVGVEKDIAKGQGMFEEVGVEKVTPWYACEVANTYLPSDPAKALKWAKHAYDNADEYASSAESCKVLGMIYLKGGKEIYDYQTAVKYLREGAELDQPECVSMMKALGEPFEEAEPSVSAIVKDYK